MKSDVTVAKNYLNEAHMKELNRIVLRGGAVADAPVLAVQERLERSVERGFRAVDRLRVALIDGLGVIALAGGDGGVQPLIGQALR